jgi:flagellin-specific chaperone FliS
MLTKSIPVTKGDYLTPREILSLYDMMLVNLKDATYYCIVENKRARTAAVETTKRALQVLMDALEESDGIAHNMKHLYQYIADTLDDINRSNNPAIAQELQALIEPLREAYIGS